MPKQPVPKEPTPVEAAATAPNVKPWDAEGGVLDAVGRQVRFVRERANKTMDEVAKLGGLRRTHISAIERGKRNATILSLQKIAVGIGCTLRDLMPKAE